VAQAQGNCKQYAWVIDLDIKGFFDNIDHERLMEMLKYHTDEKWVLMYVWRWLTAGVENEGIITARTKGTPQGGVISPLLANVYLHHSFDQWMEQEHIGNPFERYADDIIVHCKRRKEAEQLLDQIRERMLGYNLTLHPEKTKIVFCKNEKRKMPDTGEQVKFTFLGFDFQPKGMRSKQGESYLSYCVAIGRAAKTKITAAINASQIPKMVTATIDQIVDMINPKVRGWLNYYGKFRKWEMQSVMTGLNKRLVQWARNKYKLKGKRASFNYMKAICKERPDLFAHWEWGMRP
jgi:RNA-directed DNA polymerase